MLYVRLRYRTMTLTCLAIISSGKNNRWHCEWEGLSWSNGEVVDDAERVCAIDGVNHCPCAHGRGALFFKVLRKKALLQTIQVNYLLIFYTIIDLISSFS